MNTQPLSHLTLERYALGELPQAEAMAIAAQLESSAKDREVYDAILADSAELPPLPQLDLPNPASTTPSKPAPVTPLRRILPIAIPLATAALALLALLPKSDPGLEPPLHLPSGVKGDDVILSIVGEQSGLNAERRMRGERLKLRVTCPPGTLERARVTILQGDEVFHPLPEVSDFPCGNQVPWPAAFRLTGDTPATLCVHWAEDLETANPETGKRTTCLPLPPE